LLRAEDFIKSEIALASWRYGSHYGAEKASILIAQTLANRNRKWGTPWLELLTKAPQFDAAPPTTTGYPNIWDRSFLKLLLEMDGLFDGTRKDDTNGALYFGDTTNIQSKWFLMKIARNHDEHQIVAAMNSLTFWN